MTNVEPWRLFRDSPLGIIYLQTVAAVGACTMVIRKKWYTTGGTGLVYEDLPLRLQLIRVACPHHGKSLLRCYGRYLPGTVDRSCP